MIDRDRGLTGTEALLRRCAHPREGGGQVLGDVLAGPARFLR